MKPWTEFRFVADDHGVVRVEVDGYHELTGRSGLAGPAVRARPDHDFELTTFGAPNLSFVRASAVASASYGWLAGQSHRVLNLAVGSPERPLIEALAGQDRLRVVWVSEGLEVLYMLPEERRESLRWALDTAVGRSAEELYALLIRFGTLREELASFGVKPPRARPRHTVRTPQPPVAFFANQTGALPRAGRPRAAGRRLPAGQRAPGSDLTYWISDERLDDAVAIAGELARLFPETGLWPLLWRYDEDPEDYLPIAEDPAVIDTLDPETLLAALWREHAPHHPSAIHPFNLRFPGLAISSATPEPLAADPCAALAALADLAARLMLVPCHRPADAITLVGGLACETAGPQISAVLRSWEQRFGAMVIAVQPSLLLATVTHPPGDGAQALALAAEHWAFCPPADTGHATPIRDIASRLSTDTGLPGHDLTRGLWPIGWYD